ncbi:MAG: hypothetical protein ABII76_09785 [Pseudomonadota bacterium]
MADRREIIGELFDGTPVRIVVTEAHALEGMKRARLAAHAERENEHEEDVDRAILHMLVYPPLIAATVEAEGIPWPLTFEQFLELPDTLMRPWEDAVFGLNPHWIPKSDEEMAAQAEEDEKNVSRSASA